MANKTVKPGDSGTGALRRVARHYARQARRRLSPGQLTDSAVHGARKALKKSRTAVHLLRAALGHKAYQRENTRLRDAAHALNAARDARVMVQTLESLRRRHRRLQSDPVAVRLARVLREEQGALQRGLRRPDLLARSRRSLQQVAHRAGHWPVGGHGWSVLGPALRRIYKGGRQAMPAAHPRPSDAALHEWRKQVKYLRYALQMLAPIQPRELARLARQTEALTDCLGAAHDLAVLAQKARRVAGSDPLAAQPLLHAIDQERLRLTRSALSRGGRLFRAPPRDLDQRLGRYWHEWRRERAA